MIPPLMRPSRSLARLRTATLTGVIAAVTLLSGCSSSEPASPQAPPSTKSSEWNPESWKPHSTFKRPQYTEDEKLQSRQSQLDQYVRMGATPRDFPINRWVSKWEFADIMVAELGKHGIGAVANSTGGLYFVPGVPEAQEAVLNQIYYDTYSQFPIEPIYVTDFLPEQLGMLWDYWTEYYVPCMTAQGFKVEHSPVSRETFISSFFLPGTEHWWPASASSIPNLDRQLELERICPPLPAAKYFYGE